MAKQTKVNKQLAQVSDLIDLKMQSTQKFVPFENDMIQHFEKSSIVQQWFCK